MIKLEKYGTVLTEVDLTIYNTYGVESSCDYLVMPDTINHLKELIDILKEGHVRYFVLGSCSNVILPSEHFNGIIIKLDNLKELKLRDDYIEADAGIKLTELVNFLIRNEKGGFEILGTIPGTLGGAIYGNAGMKDLCIMDYVISIDVIRDGELITLNHDDIEYSYRYTSFKDNDDIIVRAKLKIEDKDSETMKEELKNIRLKRVASQPIEYKNAGSVFRNPEGDYAGRLIEKCGLKGYNVGDAYVSEKHANFIINKGNASSEDIKELIDIIVSKVKEECNVDLKLEQIIIEWE